MARLLAITIKDVAQENFTAADLEIRMVDDDGSDCTLHPTTLQAATRLLLATTELLLLAARLEQDGTVTRKD